VFKRNWKLLIKDILESIEKIEVYIKDINFNEFENDNKTKDAESIKKIIVCY